jgi:hypothetical protein
VIAAHPLSAAPQDLDMAEFIQDTVFKRDIFSETVTGHFAGAPDVRIIRRIVSAAPLVKAARLDFSPARNPRAESG